MIIIYSKKDQLNTLKENTFKEKITKYITIPNEDVAVDCPLIVLPLNFTFDQLQSAIGIYNTESILFLGTSINDILLKSSEKE